MAGRKTKLTPEVQEIIVDGINAGLTLGLTCARAGVARSTFYDWLEKGETAKSGVLMEFSDTVSRSRARADSAMRLVSQINATGPDGLAGGGVPARATVPRRLRQTL